MNVVSILSAMKAQAPQPPPPVPVLRNSQSAISSSFQGQLVAAIEDRKSGAKDAKQDDTGKDVKRPVARKQGDAPQQPTVMANATIAQLPPPPVATLGLPSAGSEPESGRSDTSKAAPELISAPVAVTPALNVRPDAPLVAPLVGLLVTAGQSPASDATDPMPMRPPAAAVEFVKPDSDTELAFALRLTGRPSNDDVQSTANVTAPALALVPVTPEFHATPAFASVRATPEFHATPALASDPATPDFHAGPAFVSVPATPDFHAAPALASVPATSDFHAAPALASVPATPEFRDAPALASVPAAPEIYTAPAPTPQIHATPDQRVQPDQAIQPDTTTRSASTKVLPTPLITLVGAAAMKQSGSAPQSGAHPGEGNSPNKETPGGVPKTLQPEPVEVKFPRPSSVASGPAIHAVSGSSPEALSSATFSIVPTPAAAVASQPSTSAPVARPAEPISEPPLAPARPAVTPQVTDVSVTVPVPRPGESIDDRIAIRMVQKGAEIHVSVRTPDTQLAQSVRQDLGKLSTGLDQAGFHTETWRPTVANAAAQSNANPQRESSQGGPSRDGSAQDSQSGSHGGGSFGEQRRRQQDERPRWVAELDEQSKP